MVKSAKRSRSCTPRFTANRIASDFSGNATNTARSSSEAVHTGEAQFTITVQHCTSNSFRTDWVSSRVSAIAISSSGVTGTTWMFRRFEKKRCSWAPAADSGPLRNSSKLFAARKVLRKWPLAGASQIRYSYAGAVASVFFRSASSCMRPRKKNSFKPGATLIKFVKILLFSIRVAMAGTGKCLFTKSVINSLGSMWTTNRFRAASGYFTPSPSSETASANSANGWELTTSTFRPARACFSPAASATVVLPTPPLPQKITSREVANTPFIKA